jgi:ribosomal-protein-alanine N-acetyltransferase
MPDARTMAEIHAAAFTQSRPWSEAEFDAFLRDRLCFAQGDARCFALIRVVAGEAELLTIATHPDHQRKGLARQVMSDWLRTAQSKGATQAFLEVAEDNAPAKALYDACGFSTCGRRKGYYPRHNAPAVDAIVMTRADLNDY